MAFELLEKKDIERIEQQNEEIIALLKKSQQNTSRVLNSTEIRDRLGYKSFSSFYSRLPELTKFGLYKNGGYKMRECDFLKYFNHLKLKNNENN